MDSPGKRWEKFRATAEQAQQEGMFEFAETAWTAALEQAEDFGDTDRRLAYTLEKMAECLWHQGKLTDAANHCKRVLKMYEKVLGPQHPDVACFMGNLAMIYHARKMYEDAEVYYKKALEIKTQILGADNPDVKKLQGNYADLLFVTNREEEAADLKTGASVVTASDWRKTTAANFQYAGKPTEEMQMVPAGTGNYRNMADSQTIPPAARAAEPVQQAPDVASRAISSIRGSATSQANKSTAQKPKPVPMKGAAPPPPPPPPPGQKLRRAEPPPMPTPTQRPAQMSKEEAFEKWKHFKENAERETAQNNIKEAEDHWIAALAVAEAIGEENPPLSYTLYSLGDLKARQEVYDIAVTYHQRAYVIKKKVLGERHPAVSASANSLARLFYYMRDYGQAEQLTLECVKIYEINLGKEHQEVASSLHNLATLYHVQRKYNEAEPVYKRALDIKQKVYGQEHPETLRLLKSYADLLRSTGREMEAQNLDSSSTGMITGSWKTIDINETSSLRATDDRCDICNAKLEGAPRCPKCGFEAAIGVI